MPLRLTRSAGSKLFVGRNIDPDNMAFTADHTVWTRSVRTGEGMEEAILNISTPRWTVEREFEPGDVVRISDDISVKLKGCFDHLQPQPEYCSACGRGDQKTRRELPMARIEVDAPRNVTILRDDIREKS